ncbi:helix-turn-helix transcriptional regulator [Marivirga lumbricoides]|uniref:helix-turn-helix transcriptional regulator n=1 Tax=Marivirga lumbricoides TaxID=1046115 RepID=UPI00166AACB2
MSVLIDRIQFFIAQKGISMRQFEMSIGASNGVISNAIKNSKDIRASWLSIIIETYPEIDANWLLTGKGEMISKENSYTTQIMNEPLLEYGNTKAKSFIDAFAEDLKRELYSINKRLSDLENRE